jgi:hypothetical protein
LIDLLVGTGDGSVWFYRNVGTAKAPRLAVGRRLVPPGNASFDKDAPKTPQRGIRSKVCAIDWNGDGRLDLLVGDFATQKPDLPEPTPAQKAEHAKLREELGAVRKEYGQCVDKLFGSGRVKAKEEREKVEKGFKEVRKRLEEIQHKLPPEYEDHGWVWLFVRKPAGSNTAIR